MNLWDNTKDAFDAAVKQFFRQKTDAHIYIYPVKLGRMTFFTVLSASQVAKYKIKKQDGIWVVGNNETILEHKRIIQQSKPDEKDLAVYKALQTYHRAKGKLDRLIDRHPEYSKMKGGAGAEAGEPLT